MQDQPLFYPHQHPTQPSQIRQRQSWMSTLAKASLDHLERQVKQLGELPTYELLRVPEIGLAMVQGRAGGTGQPFYLGEMTLTRCVVRLQLQADEEAITPEGELLCIAGFGYVAGRSHRHAELAAVCDALLQHPIWHDAVRSTVIEPLQQEAQRRHEHQQRQVEATRVNFFTMLRGES
ncbi:phosphonate C-P lyase system protein PhnG [Oscillatoria sp. FACHB-1407]|uniref:phosphonate C-P lyase system protein PhnG n=1 Tax=Oscillatoria sp. FACHB-1407 TaxID=2692847 RepID=UPI0016869E08|nr:phosphonate C-P lyase system protein PhnG [Oscillatoria sp. FACHB-1407]MBD2464137.1 phosphonate C-P lyase system protein PhnG [Oscillatoria sp. FACHB-1407]